MMGAAGGGELAALLANLKNPEVIQDQLKDLDRRRDLAGQAEAAAKTAQAEADETLQKSEAAARRAESALARLETARTKREERLAELEESLAERESALKEAEEAAAVTLSEAAGREKDTKRDSVSIKARIARHKEKEAKLASREATIGAFMREVAHLKTALED